MTQQEMFNTVATALMAQGVAATEGSACRYRGANGTKCAVGHLIPDEKYDADLEGRGAGSEKVRAAASISDANEGLARSLQVAHDHNLNCYGIDDWKREMRRIATDLRLDPSVLD